MYIPEHFKEENKEELLAFIRAHNFGTLVTANSNQPLATHLPFVVQEREGRIFLISHMAKANPQWTSFGNQPPLVIFQGPHGYISPVHYEKKKNVPTWNYIAVHAYGQVKLITGEQQLRELMETTIAEFEDSFMQQFRELPADYVDGMLKAITGFEIEVTSLQGKYKLSQNKTSTEQQNIIDDFSVSDDSAKQEIANEMKKKFKMKSLLNIVTLMFSLAVRAQMPDTDLWLAELTVTEGSLTVGEFVNITNRPGYDNQPAFAPNGNYILFSSISKDQSDILAFNLKKLKIDQYTSTPVSEYSPTFVPGRKAVSTVIVEADSTQRLWEISDDPQSCKVILPGIDSVAYHCWLNSDTVLYSTTEEPSRLYIASVSSGKTSLLCSNAGRCIKPGTGFCYYTQLTDGQHLVRRSDQPDAIVAKLPAGVQDYEVIAQAEKQLIVYGTKASIVCVEAGSGRYIYQKVVTADGLKNITRITISPDKKMLVVAAENE